MIHQLLGDIRGQATDIEIHAREILQMRERMNAILAKHTGRTVDQIKLDTERDRYLTAEDAKEILLIRDKLNDILAKHTGQPIDKVALDTERDNFMSGEEAVAYGLVDEVLASRADRSART